MKVDYRLLLKVDYRSHAVSKMKMNHSLHMTPLIKYTKMNTHTHALANNLYLYVVYLVK